MKNHNPGRGYQNEFRIIAGAWRRRKLNFPPLPGIRPSPDRVRETLFNWLREYVRGARCLDLFAGSGALGIEALSRGANSVTFVDREREAVDAISGHLALLEATDGEVIQADALEWLKRAPEPFDIVFLDPPFDSDLAARALTALEAGGWLEPATLIYMEYAAEAPPPLPEGWQLLRESRAGRVGFRLIQRKPG